MGLEMWTRASGTTDRFVMVADVLGFRVLLDELGVEALAQRYRRLIEEVDRLTQWEVSARTFSDTILCYSPAFETGKAFPDRPDIDFTISITQMTGFMGFCGSLLASGLEHGLPLRAGVACGPCHIDEDAGIFVGNAIVDAYLTEMSQEWSGVGLHPSCFSWMPVGPEAIGWMHLLEYSVPVKDDAPVKDLDWTINWVAPPHRQARILELLHERVNRFAGTEFEGRWRRTLEFAESMSTRGDEGSESSR